MVFTNKCNDKIEQVDMLKERFGISENHCFEIINIYFEFFSNISFDEYIKKQIRVFYDKNDVLEKIDEDDDVCAFEGSDYILVTNYESVKKLL